MTFASLLLTLLAGGLLKFRNMLSENAKKSENMDSKSERNISFASNYFKGQKRYAQHLSIHNLPSLSTARKNYNDGVK